MGRVKLTIAYDGTDFCGWQIQPKVRTVQAVIEHALHKICGSMLRVHGSGRTDSGVHALGQVAHFDSPKNFVDIPWDKALNAKLPADVRILEARPATHDFHARDSAFSKTYSYLLWCDRQKPLPQRRNFVWACGMLDVPAMQQAASVLIGKHDFAAFQNAGTPVRSTIREVMAIDVEKTGAEKELLWRFTASGFLRQMVRNMMGCLVEVGRGKIDAKQVQYILQSLDRTVAPLSAPPQGLTLEHVQYPLETC